MGKKIRTKDKNLGIAVEQIEVEAYRRNESPGESMHGFERQELKVKSFGTIRSVQDFTQ